jgi:hypothetical protein
MQAPLGQSAALSVLVSRTLFDLGADYYLHLHCIAERDGGKPSFDFILMHWQAAMMWTMSDMVIFFFPFLLSPLFCLFPPFYLLFFVHECVFPLLFFLLALMHPSAAGGCHFGRQVLRAWRYHGSFVRQI